MKWSRVSNERFKSDGKLSGQDSAASSEDFTPSQSSLYSVHLLPVTAYQQNRNSREHQFVAFSRPARSFNRSRRERSNATKTVLSWVTVTVPGDLPLTL